MRRLWKEMSSCLSFLHKENELVCEGIMSSFLSTGLAGDYVLLEWSLFKHVHIPRNTMDGLWKKRTKAKLFIVYPNSRPINFPCILSMSSGIELVVKSRIPEVRTLLFFELEPWGSMVIHEEHAPSIWTCYLILNVGNVLGLFDTDYLWSLVISKSWQFAPPIVRENNSNVLSLPTSCELKFPC